MVVYFASSDYTAMPVDGSTLYIDNLRLKNTPTDIDGLANGRNTFIVFPNPAKDILYIKPGKGTGNVATLHIYDMAGRIVGKHELKSNLGGIMQVQLSGYVPGVYQYEIQSGDAITRGKFVKE
ncbi:MAG TPA: T9SS type A sorting domain-containing protein [Flavipsychrobacter sp.]